MTQRVNKAVNRWKQELLNHNSISKLHQQQIGRIQQHSEETQMYETKYEVTIQTSQDTPSLEQHLTDDIGRTMSNEFACALPDVELTEIKDRFPGGFTAILSVQFAVPA